MKQVIFSIFIVLLLAGCGENNDDSPVKTTAYYGDKEYNQVVVVDVDNMTLSKNIPTGYETTYAAEVVKTKDTHNNPIANNKLYVDNRGSDVISVIDSSTNEIVKHIFLDFHPRSIDVQKETGLVAVSGVDKAKVAIIDSKTDEVISTVGDDTVTNPTTSGHSYLASGTMASGHPHWLNQNHFVLIDRQNKKIQTYKIEKDSDNTWQTTFINELNTSSPVHNLIPPEIHGHKGNKHTKDGHDQISTIFYATAEGAPDIYPSVLKLEFLDGTGLSELESLELKKDGIDVNTTGVHHLNFLKDQKTIYVGSDEGTLFVVDYLTSPMSITKTILAGKGAGHTDEMKHENIAVVINHKDRFITLMNTITHTKIADINVSLLSDDIIGTTQTQSHPMYHFSKDGKYFYLFLTQEGSLVKVDITNKTVVQRLELGGKLAMGSFISTKNGKNH
jgi:YVTN family beta-propeller protein